MSEDQVAFLRARYAEDAGADWHVLDCSGMPHGDGPCCEVQARIPREVEAKRAILDRVVPQIDELDAMVESEWGMGKRVPTGESNLLLSLLLLPYRDHPDFDPQWGSVGVK